MANDVQVERVGWSSTQAHVFAAICLGVGFTVGYLLHAPANSSVVSAQRAASENTPQPVQAMPSPEQIKHMGDKMAEPLLTELKTDQNNPETLAKVASVYLRAGQIPLAIEYFEKSLKAKPSAEGYVSLSSTYHYAGEDDQAIAMLNRALEIDPKSANALFNLGMLEWKTKNDPQAAVQAWQLLLKNNPKHPKRELVEQLIRKVKQNTDSSQAEAKIAE
jgi:cytochrome c-type biogenesis protein CcmH/NrfG